MILLSTSTLDTSIPNIEIKFLIVVWLVVGFIVFLENMFGEMRIVGPRLSFARAVTWPILLTKFLFKSLAYAITGKESWLE